jgi:hypothetical protein
MFPPTVYEGSFSPHPLHHLLLFVSLLVVNLTGVRWDLSVVLICISFMVNMLNISSCIYESFVFSSSENFLCNLFTHLLIGLFVLLIYL